MKVLVGALPDEIDKGVAITSLNVDLAKHQSRLFDWQ